MKRSTALGGGAEFDLIRRFLASADAGASRAGAAAADEHVVVGPGDDSAVLRGGPLAVSVDLSVEDIHFRREWLGPHEIGYRSAMIALSDLAAMAAEPVAMLVSIALPPRDRAAFAPAVLDGVNEAAHELGASVIGGDVARTTGPLTIDVVAIGRVERPVLRSDARDGQLLWLTGRPGGATAALMAWESGTTPDATARAAYARPRPRTREACWLNERGVLMAMIDVSDGIGGDAAHLSAASGVLVEINAARVPVHAALRALAADGEDACMRALHGGDDYELLFTAAAGAVEPLVDGFEEQFGLPLTRIGRVRAGTGVMLRRTDGSVAPLVAGGYDHFRESTA